MHVALIPLVVALLVFAVVYLTYLTAAGHARGTERVRIAQRRVKEVTDLAYAHDEISEALAGAVIERTRGVTADTSVHTLEAILDDVLDLARQHRATEPDLAVIVIDTVRRDEGPHQLG